MPIDPLHGFDAKSEIGRSPVPQPSPGPTPTPYSFLSPKEKIRKLYSLFPNKFGNYFIFDKPFVEHTGRVNFVNQKQRKLFFSRLYKYNKDIYIKYLNGYNEHDNYFYINNVENSKQEKDFILKLYHETLIETIPKNLIQFIYLNEKFSDWPGSEQRRFLIFIKTVGGEDALEEFDKSIVQDVENRERGFREWLGEQKVIPKWLDKYGNPDMIAKINFIEKLFSRLDDIVIPKIIAMPHDPSHPEKDPRYTLLCEYAYFIVARNAVNPISWYVGFCSVTKLSEEWDKLVYLCKSGSPEEFALFLGQVIGTLLTIPLGIKIGTLSKGKMPIAIATVKTLIKKATKGKIDPAKIEAVLNRPLFSKKPMARKLIERFNGAKTIKGKLGVVKNALDKRQDKLAARLCSKLLDEVIKEVEQGKVSRDIDVIESYALRIRAHSKQLKEFHGDAGFQKYVKDIGDKITDLYEKLKPINEKAYEVYIAKLKLKAQKWRVTDTNTIEVLKNKFNRANIYEKLEIADMAYFVLGENELAAELYGKMLLGFVSKQKYSMTGDLFARLYFLAKDSGNIRSITTIKKILESARDIVWRTKIKSKHNPYYSDYLQDYLRLRYNIIIRNWYGNNWIMGP